MELLAAVLRRPEWSIMTRSAHDSDVTDDVIVSHMHVRYPSAARAGPSRAIWASPVKRTFISTVALSTSAYQLPRPATRKTVGFLRRYRCATNGAK